MPVAEVQDGRDGDEDRETLSPSPDLSHHDFHAPSRKSSREHKVPHVVIPSSDTYGSDTPSPLSPITPPDRLSPIEELDDNASILSGKAAKQLQFETSSLLNSSRPRARPLSSEFDLQAINEDDEYPLEARAEMLFSRQHLEMIFADKELLLRFGTFLRTYRPDSVPVLAYYHDTIKALRTLKYAEAVVKGLEKIPGLEFTADSNGVTMTWVLEDKANRALDILAKNDLPAFIAYVYVTIVDLALVERVTGKADMDGNDVAIGLAEVFTISDPSRPDNPLVFASDEFHRMTQYPANHALGRNCRFLGGPKTDPNAISRFKTSLDSEREHCEVMLNYRRDGNPFMNLVMVVPLRDQNGKVRYYLGAQLDITELVNTSTGLVSLQNLISRKIGNSDEQLKDKTQAHVDLLTEFQQLSETFSTQEMQSLMKSQQRQQMEEQVTQSSEQSDGQQPQSIRIKDSLSNLDDSVQTESLGNVPPLGFYKNYLLVRPHPSLRILFASPDMRAPGILQAPLMHQIGGSARVRDDLYHALEAGQKVTAKVMWLIRPSQDESRPRWIHCTPLISANGLIGVWMVILVDDEEDMLLSNNPSQAELAPAVNKPNEAYEPTPWESIKANSLHPNGRDRGSPATTDSSQTAFSESAKPDFGKPIYEKVPPNIQELHETVNLPYAKKRASSTGMATIEIKPDDVDALRINQDDPSTPDRSPDPHSRFTVTSADSFPPPPKHPNRPHARFPDPRADGGSFSPTTDKPLPNPPTSNHQQQQQQQQTLHPTTTNTSTSSTTTTTIRPGPKIAGRAYSFVSNHSSDPADDARTTSSKGASDHRPISRESIMTAIPQPQFESAELKWRIPDEREVKIVPEPLGRLGSSGGIKNGGSRDDGGGGGGWGSGGWERGGGSGSGSSHGLNRSLGSRDGLKQQQPPVNMPGRPQGRQSQDTGAGSGSGSGDSPSKPALRKTKKSLSPYGFLFD